MEESANREFKRELSKAYLKKVSAFANFGMGKIKFGVDNDGALVGLRDPDDARFRIENATNDSMRSVPPFLSRD